MKKIIVIATGGTIAGSGEDGRTTEYRAGTIDVSDILETIPQINNLAEIEMVPLISVDSNEMNERHWIKLRNTINEQAKRPDVDGIVITHGTDTIEETAYFDRSNASCHRNESRWSVQSFSGNCSCGK